jgi:hypothetical protein
MEGMAWPGQSGTFENGRYYRRDEYALDPGHSGEFYQIVDMEQIGDW